MATNFSDWTKLSSQQSLNVHIQDKSNPHKTFTLEPQVDTRDVATKPSDYYEKDKGELKFVGIKLSETIGLSRNTFSSLIGLCPWHDNSADNSHELAFNNAGIWHRSGTEDTWGNWNRLVEESQLSNYLPLTGGTLNGKLTLNGNEFFHQGNLSLLKQNVLNTINDYNCVGFGIPYSDTSILTNSAYPYSYQTDATMNTTNLGLPITNHEWYHIQYFRHRGEGYGSQIALCFAGGIYYRNSQATNWGDWVQLAEKRDLPTSNQLFYNKGLNAQNIDSNYGDNFTMAVSENGFVTRPNNYSGWLNIINFNTTHFTSQIAMTCTIGTNADRQVRMFIRERYMASDSGWSNWVQVTPNYGTSDLVAGSSALNTGEVYLVYE